MLKSKFIFCGVKPGYHNITEFTPSMAANIVSELLVKYGVNVPVYKGLVVYPYESGCPIGGEPVGAFRLSGDMKDILSIGNYLRKELNQVTLNIPVMGGGIPTQGFTAEVIGNAYDFGKKWQETAKKYMSSSDIHVSAGIIITGKDSFIISADANPHSIADLTKWQKTAQQIFSELDGGELVFQDSGYLFLPGMP